MKPVAKAGLVASTIEIAAYAYFPYDWLTPGVR